MSCAHWSQYEAIKQRWINRHPAATPRQYEAAMRRIARSLGL